MHFLWKLFRVDWNVSDISPKDPIEISIATSMGLAPGWRQFIIWEKEA